MARMLRIEHPGAIYHVMTRGDRWEAIFQDDQDRELFTATLAEACAKADWQVHAYCLMGNHFHLVVETPRANLVAGMKWFLATYRARFNPRQELFGHLLSGRHKALVVDAVSPGCFGTGRGYVHLNPVREVALAGAAAGGARVEQLPGVSEATVATLALRACGCPGPWCIAIAVDLNLSQFDCAALPCVSWGDTVAESVASIKIAQRVSFDLL